MYVQKLQKFDALASKTRCYMYVHNYQTTYAYTYVQ